MNIDYALTDPGFFSTGNPHEIWKRLRQEDPVHWTQGKLKRGFWSLTRHADGVAMLKDADIYSSELGGTFLPADDSMEGIGMDTLGRGIAMLAMDPPRHAKFRKIVAGPYALPAVAKLEEHARSIVRKVFDEVMPQGSCDLVADIALKVPLAMICEIMNIPPSDWSYILKITNMVVGSADPDLQNGDSGASFAKGFNALADYGLSLATERRKCPASDTLSSLGHGTVDGRALTTPEIRSNAAQIIGAGIETTRNTFVSGILELIERPEQFQLLRADRSLLNSAVAEFLRFCSPLVHIMRTTTRDVDLAGTLIRAGDRVVLWNPSANRDERVFSDPDMFDIQRNPNPHLSFGYGIHSCMGAHLARLELRVMLEELLNRMDKIAVTAKPQKLQSNWLSGYKTMPISFEAAA